MKTFLNFSLATCVIIFTALVACSTIQKYAVVLEVPEKAASIIDRYCEEIPLSERLKTREAVNKLTRLGEITIICEGD